MKPADKDIKKAFERMNIPEPSASARKRTVQKAMDEFVHKTVVREKKSQGFTGFIRRMGKTLLNSLTLQGGPIMTQKHLATLGILVLAVGLFLSIGPQVFHSPVKNFDPGDQDAAPETGREQPGDRHSFPADSAKTETAIPSSGEKKIPAAEAQPAGPAGLLQKSPEALPSTGPEKSRTRDRGFPAVLSETTAGKVSGHTAMEPDEGYAIPGREHYRDEGRDSFAEITRNPIRLVSEEPVSTFSIDVDTASYAFVRRQLNSGVLPQKDAVRVEEMINYFDYDYPVPKDRTQPFRPTVALYPTPWNSSTRLLHIGIKGYDIVPAEKPRSNLVFLLDVSGSMNSPDKLPLLKNSFSMLVESLEPEDTVAIVVYAGAAGTVLEPTRAEEKGRILAALNRLNAGGSTAGGEGIELAYSLAEMQYDRDAVNRVILATDGDFNVGITDRRELKSFIERKRETGIFLSVLGFGQGNYNDALMQDLAQNGNGNAAFIDNLNEARKVLVDEAGGTLFTIARDVKIQIEFNPARVNDYRLIGYETRLLNREDFNNDRVDAGDVGSGHSVTAIYEITPAGSAEKLIDDLRYRETGATPQAVAEDEYAFLKIRYKLPDADTSSLITMPVTPGQEYDAVIRVPQDLRFAAAVAAFGQVLRNDPFTGDFGYDEIIALAEPARGRDPFGYRAEFLNLVRLAKTAKAM